MWSTTKRAPMSSDPRTSGLFIEYAKSESQYYYYVMTPSGGVRLVASPVFSEDCGGLIPSKLLTAGERLTEPILTESVLRV